MAKKKTSGSGPSSPFNGPTGIRHGFGEGEWNSNQKAKLRGETPGAASSSSLPQMRASAPSAAHPADMREKVSMPGGAATTLGSRRFEVGGTLPPSNSPPGTSFQARYNPGGGTGQSSSTATPAAPTATPARAATAAAHRPRAARPATTASTGRAMSLDENVARGGIDLRRPQEPTAIDRINAPITNAEARVGAPASRTSQMRVPPNMAVATQPGRYQRAASSPVNDGEDHTVRNLGIGAAIVGGGVLLATRSPRVAAAAARATPAIGAALRSVGPRIAAAAPAMARGAVSAVRSTAARVFTRNSAQSAARHVVGTGASILAPELAGRGVAAATGSEAAGNMARTATAVGMGARGGPGGARNVATRVAAGTVGSVALGEGGGALGAAIDRRIGNGQGHGGESLLRSVGSLTGAAAGAGAVRGVQERRAVAPAQAATNRTPTARQLPAAQNRTMPPPTGRTNPAVRVAESTNGSMSSNVTGAVATRTVPPPVGRPRTPVRDSPTPTDANWDEGLRTRATRGTRAPAAGSGETDPQPQFEQRNVEARRAQMNSATTARPPARRPDTSPSIEMTDADMTVPPRAVTVPPRAPTAPPRAATVPPAPEPSVQATPARRTPAPRRRAPAAAPETPGTPVEATPAPVAAPEVPVRPAAGTVRRPGRGATPAGATTGIAAPATDRPDTAQMRAISDRAESASASRTAPVSDLPSGPGPARARNPNRLTPEEESALDAFNPGTTAPPPASDAPSPRRLRELDSLVAEQTRDASRSRPAGGAQRRAVPSAADQIRARMAENQAAPARRGGDGYRPRFNGMADEEGFAGPSGINHGAFSHAKGGGLVRGEPNLTPIKSNHGFGRSNVKF